MRKIKSNKQPIRDEVLLSSKMARDKSDVKNTPAKNIPQFVGLFQPSRQRQADEFFDGILYIIKEMEADQQTGD